MGMWICTQKVSFWKDEFPRTKNWNWWELKSSSTPNMSPASFVSWQANKLYSKWFPKKKKNCVRFKCRKRAWWCLFLQLSVGHTAHQHCCREPAGFFPQFILLKMVSLGQNVGVFYWNNVSRCFFWICMNVISLAVLIFFTREYLLCIVWYIQRIPYNKMVTLLVLINAMW